MLYQYQTIIQRIVDGDTIEVDIDLGFDTWIKRARVRLVGIDCPELRTSDPVEKVFGKAATAFVEELLPVGSTRTLLSIDYRRDSFARIIGDFRIPNRIVPLTSIIMSSYHGVKWNPKDRDQMEADHMKNREMLIELGQVSGEFVEL